MLRRNNKAHRSDLQGEKYGDLSHTSFEENTSTKRPSPKHASLGFTIVGLTWAKWSKTKHGSLFARMVYEMREYCR